MIPENIAEDEATRKIVMDAISSLPAQSQILLMEFYFNGKQIKDIARDLGMSESAAKTRLSRSRNTLKEKFLAIEKEQGIRLHSVGIVPFIFFAFYMFMQEKPVSEQVSIAAANRIFTTPEVKSLISAASGSGKAASSEAKLNKVESQHAEAKQTTKKAAKKAAKTAAKTAGGSAAKTAGLSAAVKGIIIGVSAAVVIGAAATAAVVVKNNNESRIAAEAEAETEEIAAETEEIAAETETETTTEEVDETMLMYQLYYDKILELQEEYGGKEFINEVDFGIDYYSAYYNGICYAELIDLDSDGTEEMIIAYEDTNYKIEIWGYEDGAMVKILSESICNFNWFSGFSPSICIGCDGDTYYIALSGNNSNDTDYFDYKVYTFEHNEAVLVKYLKCSSPASDAPVLDDRLDYYIDDNLVTMDEYAEELAFIDNNCDTAYVRYFEMRYSYFSYYEEIIDMMAEYGKIEENIYITEDQFEYTMSGPKLDETIAFLSEYLE